MLIFYFQNCQFLFLSSVILWYSLALYFRFADNAQLYKNIDLLTIETLVSGVYYILVQNTNFVPCFTKHSLDYFKKKMYGTDS